MIKHYYNPDKEAWTGLTLAVNQAVITVPKGWKLFPKDWTNRPEGYEFVGSKEAGFRIGEPNPDEK